MSSFCLSCQRDPNEVVPDSPFKNLNNGDMVWNLVNLDLAYVNPKNIQEIDISVNGASIATITQPPFLYKWDSRTVPDGSNELKATMIDRNGNLKVASLNVIVRNTLLTVQVPANQLAASERAWIFLSGPNGQEVARAELKNGATIQLSNADYDSKSFILSEAYLSHGSFLDINSFEEVPRGKWTPASKSQGNQVLGSIRVNFKDSVGVHPYYISTSGDARIFLEGGNSVDLNVTQSPTKLFIREIYKSTNHYKLVDGLGPNDLYFAQFADLKTPLVAVPLTSLPGAQAVHIRIYGFPKANKFDESYSLGVFNLTGGTVVLEYPGNTFASYGSTNYLKTDQYRVDSFNPTKMSDITPLHAEVQFQDKGNNNVSVATSGRFDAYVIGWGYADKYSTINWTWTGSGGQSEFIKLMAIPDVIRTAGTVTFNTGALDFYNVVQLADYEIAADYSTFVQYLSEHGYNSPYEFGKAWKEQTFYKTGSTGGRIMTSTDPPTIREQWARN